MFDNKTITINKVNTLLQNVYNEFLNEIDSIEDVFNKTLTDEQIDFAFELLNKYINKVELTIKDELNDKESDK